MKRNAKYALAAILGCVLVLVAFQTVYGGTQGSCQSGDTSRVLLFENTIGDTRDGDDRVYLCGDTRDLTPVWHTLPGDCANRNFWSNTWNDCASSVATWIPANQAICWYQDRDYWYSNSHMFFRVNGPTAGSRLDFPTFIRDAGSSFRFVYSWSGC